MYSWDFTRASPNGVSPPVRKSLSLLYPYSNDFVDGREIDVGPGYFEPERKLMLGGRAVDTIQMGDLLIAIEK